MTLTQEDLQAISQLIDEKLKPVYEFIDFGKRALEALLEESQDTFEQKLPQRVKKLEDIHLRQLADHHTS